MVDLLTVRFFAGAAEAAGMTNVEVSPNDAQTVGDVLSFVAEGNDLLKGVLELSIFLADGARVETDAPAKGIKDLDVLPPFAGG